MISMLLLAALARASSFDAPLAIAPLDTPLVVTGGFGEYRVGHFHAGFDFGTGKKVGKPVRAPLPGWVARVRASGVGYGRSIYLRTTDGRLLQFGHLDAYAEPLASYVDSIQRATGQYEQDLWPEAGRFRVKVGQRIAWTGESGAGGPHMHFEIRRGDMAYQPERAGLRSRDTRAPSIESVTLEPLDDTSFVERSALPRTVKFGTRVDTVHAIGRVRAIVAARDGAWSGVDRMVPWSTRLEWDDQWVECRMDSISWATDMSEGDYVYDAGRVIGEKGMVLWAPAGWRPRFILSSAASGDEAGTIVVRAGDAPRMLRLSARDVAGNAVERRIILTPGAAKKEVAPDPGRLPAYRDVALPGGFHRLESEVDAFVYRSARALAVRPIGISWTAPETFDGATVARTEPARELSGGELVAVMPIVAIGPASVPLRKAFTLRIEREIVSDTTHLGLYRRASATDDWEWVGMTSRADRTGWDADSRYLGEFALFADTLAPRITIRTPPRVAPKTPYPRWQVEAAIVENGSGLDGRASYFTVDGVRVPVEWDSEGDVLRWRPLHRPAKGSHRLSVIATDRAGNQRIRSGTFVLD